MKFLLIVESPSKCKKIADFLNKNDSFNIYEVVATIGHITELKSLSNINMNNFHPTYDLIDSKKKNINIIREKIKDNYEIILGLDNDREGEAIAYHICSILNLPLTTKRIIFNEITENALQYAIKNPIIINMDIVRAQQTRQILDLLVGFKITPELWNYIPENERNNILSAGRCQIPALRIISDSCSKANTHGEKSYNIIGYFTSNNIPFSLNTNYNTDTEVKHFLNCEKEYKHVYNCDKSIKVSKKQPQPFTTSRLLQSVSNELHLPPKETMNMCQSLYESGYITYMRTDNDKYSSAFINETKKYIINKYLDGEKYILENIDSLNTSFSIEDDTSQTFHAHEAIRPTNISLSELPDTISLREKKLYKLIWRNTLESCMSPASYFSLTANITGNNNTKFSYTSELIDFAGWKIVANTPSSNAGDKNYHFLQKIKENTILIYKKIIAQMTIQNIKLHYTEAKLVQILEEKGIGRPSTFAMLVDKIQERGYVKKEDIKGQEIICNDYELETNQIKEIVINRQFGNQKGKLIIQPLGVKVIEFLDKYFIDLLNYDYTKNMEDKLDDIAKGIKVNELCKECNDQINKSLTYLRENVTKVCKKSNSLGQYEGHDVIVQKGKYGLYATWGKNTKTLKKLGNRPIENIKFEDVIQILDEEGSNIIRKISKNITIRSSIKGDYIFFKTDKMNKPVFYNMNNFEHDYKLCDIDIIKDWIKNSYDIY
jgi:DNA topoisomerase-1